MKLNWERRIFRKLAIDYDWKTAAEIKAMIIFDDDLKSLERNFLEPLVEIAELEKNDEGMYRLRVSFI